MLTQVSIQYESILNPRGEFRRKSIALAPRMADLRGKTVLLFDNNQLTSELRIYGPVFEWLAEYLQAEHGANCSHARRNLLDTSKEEFTELADVISRSGAHGVVIALCFAGITQPTSLFVTELERRGIPCVQLCTDLGYPLAVTTASQYVPGLPVVLVQPATGDKEDFGKRQTEAIAPEIVAGLTTDSARLLASFNERFSAAAHGFSGGKVLPPSRTAPATEVNGTATITIAPSDESFFDDLSAAGLSDGFPVIAPTERRVKAMLAFTDRDPGESLVDELPPSGGTITIHSLAVNAVMAGCRPEYFPILVAAFEAIADPAYRMFQGAITTHPAGNAVVVSGPLADEIGIHSGPGCLGPGFRANATIGRAVNLTIMNVSGAIPGKSDLGTFGSPAEFTYCFAESDKNNPWLPLHTDLYGPEITSVTVHKCEGPHNVADARGGPEELLRNVASTAATRGGNNMVIPGQLLVLLNPGIAAMIAKAGWSKRDIKEFLFETARHPAELVKQQGGRTAYPPYFLKLPLVPVMRSPEDVIVVVCGGKGSHSMVGIPWGRSEAVSRPVTLRNGSPLLTLKVAFKAT